MIAASEGEHIEATKRRRWVPLRSLIPVLLGVCLVAGPARADTDAQTTDGALADVDAAGETGAEVSAEAGDAAPADVPEQTDTPVDAGEQTDAGATDVAIDAGATDASGEAGADGGARDGGGAGDGSGGTTDGALDQRRYDLVEDDDGCSYGGAGRAGRTPAALTFSALGLLGLVLRRRRRPSGRTRA